MRDIRAPGRRSIVSPQVARARAQQMQAQEEASSAETEQYQAPRAARRPRSAVDEEDDGGTVVRRRRVRSRVAEDVELPNRIAVRQHDYLHMVPAPVWRNSPFKWDPQAFVIENERLKDKLVESDVQDDSLRRWIDDPSLPIIYGVTGAPDDSMARYFAAYLVQIHCQKMGASARPIWHSIYGGYRNELIDDYKDTPSQYEPTMVVLTNLASSSTPQKLEKARDILERFSSVPRIVVAAGEDPLSFLSVRLNVPANGIAYFCSDIVRRKIEVI